MSDKTDNYQGAKNSVIKNDIKFTIQLLEQQNAELTKRCIEMDSKIAKLDKKTALLEQKIKMYSFMSNLLIASIIAIFTIAAGVIIHFDNNHLELKYQTEINSLYKQLLDKK